jgi:hypothetical protein
MCNLYSLTKGQQAIRDAARAMRDMTGNMPLLPGIFPDYWFHKPASSAFPRFPGFSPPRLSTSPGSRKSTACLQSIRRIRFISDPTNKSLTEVL